MKTRLEILKTIRRIIRERRAKEVKFIDDKKVIEDFREAEREIYEFINGLI